MVIKMLKARVTVMLLSGMSQPGCPSASCHLVAVMCLEEAFVIHTWLDTAKKCAKRQPAVTSERPQLTRGSGDLVDDPEHNQDKYQSRQGRGRRDALCRIVEL